MKEIKKLRRGRKRISDSFTRADTRILTRILISLNEVGYSNKSNLGKELMGLGNCYKIGDGLNWLVNHNLIDKFTGIHSVGYYCIKGKKADIENYLKLKEKLKING